MVEVGAHGIHLDGFGVSLVPSRGLLSTIKSFYVSVVPPPSSWVLKLILSSPLLEGVSVAAYGTSVNAAMVLTGISRRVALEAFLRGGMRRVADRVLSPQVVSTGGIRFYPLPEPCLDAASRGR